MSMMVMKKLILRRSAVMPAEGRSSLLPLPRPRAKWKNLANFTVLGVVAYAVQTAGGSEASTRSTPGVQVSSRSDGATSDIMMGGHSAELDEVQIRHSANSTSVADICSSALTCASCLSRRSPRCGWCAASNTCMSDGRTCSGGYGTNVCYVYCSSDQVLHDSAGMIQFGDKQSAVPTFYAPHQTCSFTIYPLPDSSSSNARHPMLIRLQFEYIALGPNDRVDVFANGVDGQRLTSITENGAGVVNRIITSRSASMVVQLTADGNQGGAGFRAFYRVIEGSPLDIYLISAIIVTSILTCILCSCCCNNCISLIAGHTARRLVPGASHRSLSAEEKARLPSTSYGTAEEDDRYHIRECVICLSDFEDEDVIKKLPCGHIMHKACIDAWLEMSTVCPLCKKDVRGDRAADGSGGGDGSSRRRVGLRRHMAMSSYTRTNSGRRVDTATQPEAGGGQGQSGRWRWLWPTTAPSQGPSGDVHGGGVAHSEGREHTNTDDQEFEIEMMEGGDGRRGEMGLTETQARRHASPSAEVGRDGRQHGHYDDVEYKDALE